MEKIDNMALSTTDDELNFLPWNKEDATRSVVASGGEQGYKVSASGAELRVRRHTRGHRPRS